MLGKNYFKLQVIYCKLLIKWLLEQCLFCDGALLYVGIIPPSSSVVLLQVSRKPGKWQEVIKGVCLTERKVDGENEIWPEFPTYMACSERSFEKIQPCLTLTIGGILFYFPLQWSQGKAKFLCLCIRITTTGTFAYFIHPVGKKKGNNKMNNDKILKQETSSFLG